MTRAQIRYRSNSGFSLVELMVGVVIALIGIMVIFQVFSVSEGTKRTTTGGGDAQQNGSLALFAVERDVRMAGYGLNLLTVLGCKVDFYDAGPPARTLTLTLAPIEIRTPANQVPPGPNATGPDQVIVMYSANDLMPTPATIVQGMPSPASVYKVDNRFGFKEGDLVLTYFPGQDCVIAQVSNLPGTPGQTDNVIHNPGTYTDPNTGQQMPVRFNKPGGLGIAFPVNARIFDLGGLPIRNIYSVIANQLNQQNELFAAVPTPILDNIVQLQAQYGKDTNNDGIVDTWDKITPPQGSTNWKQILAVRFAMVARSTTPEKPDPATGQCTTTTVQMMPWMGGTVDLGVTGADWRCYRYKMFQTLVPMRNLIWSQS